MCVIYYYIFLIYLNFHPPKMYSKIILYSFLNKLLNVVRDISSSTELGTFYGFPIGQILEDSWIGPACIIANKQNRQGTIGWNTLWSRNLNTNLNNVQFIYYSKCSCQLATYIEIVIELWHLFTFCYSSWQIKPKLNYRFTKWPVHKLQICKSVLIEVAPSKYQKVDKHPQYGSRGCGVFKGGIQN